VIAPLSLSSLVFVASLFLVLPCRGASTSETNSASAPAPADSPPHTEYRIPNTEPPLLPQAVPLSSVQSLLDLAHSSACREAAQAIEEGNIAGGLAMLDKLTSGAFHWRGAVTNGFQQGFFVNALRGYCLERMGDIVKAYRAYQNSRAYFDDAAVAMQCPEPRLEVFLGLGRTCLVAGRYTDAFNWLDLVRLEASADPRIAAAADRGLIRRAVEIGDYHDAITNYCDLQALILESGSDLRAGSVPPSAWIANVAVDEESGHGSPSHTNTNPTAEDYKFVRPERILSREEHKELAQLYFWIHQDRPGFKTVLDGLTLLGIDNDLGANDPIIDCFVNNLQNADDAEIQRFYDLLGYAITQARALKGDENYIAVLCNARLLLCKVYSFLRPEDDLAKAFDRIAEARVALAKTVQAGPAAKRAATGARTIPAQSPKAVDAAGAPVSTPQALLENALIKADLCMRAQRGALARSLYLNALCLQSNATPPEVVYDGTTAKNAAAYGLLFLDFTTANLSDAFAHAALASDDGSLRATLALFLAQFLCGNSDALALVRDYTQRGISGTHPLLLEALQRAADACLKAGNPEHARTFVTEYEARRPLSVPIALLLVESYRIECRHEAEAKAIFALAKQGVCCTRDVKTFIPALADEDLTQLRRVILSIELAVCLFHSGSMKDAFVPFIQTDRDITTYLAAEAQLRTLRQQRNYKDLINCLYNGNLSYYHRRFEVEALIALGHTNAAWDIAWKEMSQPAECTNAAYPNDHTDLIETLLDGVPRQRWHTYRDFLLAMQQRFAKRGATNAMLRVQQQLTNLSGRNQQ